MSDELEAGFVVREIQDLPMVELTRVELGPPTVRRGVRRKRRACARAEVFIAELHIPGLPMTATCSQCGKPFGYAVTERMLRRREVCDECRKKNSQKSQRAAMQKLKLKTGELSTLHREINKVLRMTQADAGKVLGLSSQLVQQVERGALSKIREHKQGLRVESEVKGREQTYKECLERWKTMADILDEEGLADEANAVRREASQCKAEWLRILDAGLVAQGVTVNWGKDPYFGTDLV
ncbi:MAG: hypothetical protein WCO56_28635 [Verrucomicrobiota bacterium]